MPTAARMPTASGAVPAEHLGEPQARGEREPGEVAEPTDIEAEEPDAQPESQPPPQAPPVRLQGDGLDGVERRFESLEARQRIACADGLMTEVTEVDLVFDLTVSDGELDDTDSVTITVWGGCDDGHACTEGGKLGISVGPVIRIVVYDQVAVSRRASLEEVGSPGRAMTVGIVDVSSHRSKPGLDRRVHRPVLDRDGASPSVAVTRDYSARCLDSSGARDDVGIDPD